MGHSLSPPCGAVPHKQGAWCAVRVWGVTVSFHTQVHQSAQALRWIMQALQDHGFSAGEDVPSSGKRNPSSSQQHRGSPGISSSPMGTPASSLSRATVHSTRLSTLLCRPSLSASASQAWAKPWRQRSLPWRGNPRKASPHTMCLPETSCTQGPTPAASLCRMRRCPGR